MCMSTTDVNWMPLSRGFGGRVGQRNPVIYTLGVHLVNIYPCTLVPEIEGIKNVHINNCFASIITSLLLPPPLKAKQLSKYHIGPLLRVKTVKLNEYIYIYAYISNMSPSTSVSTTCHQRVNCRAHPNT